MTQIEALAAAIMELDHNYQNCEESEREFFAEVIDKLNEIKTAIEQI